MKKHLVELVRRGVKRQTIRLWSRPIVRVGQISYTPGLGKMKITAVDLLSGLEALTEADARADGFGDLAALLGEIRRIYGAGPAEGRRLYRVRFSWPIDAAGEALILGEHGEALSVGVRKTVVKAAVKPLPNSAPGRRFRSVQMSVAQRRSLRAYVLAKGRGADFFVVPEWYEFANVESLWGAGGGGPRTKLAAACWLFVVVSSIQIAHAIVTLTIYRYVTRVQQFQIDDIFYTVQAGVIIAAASTLFLANLTRQISPWPRCGILVFFVLYAVLEFTLLTSWSRHLLFHSSGRYVVYVYEHIFLPLSVAMCVANACAFACGVIYALQLAAFFHSPLLRKGALFILGPSLLFSVSITAFWANILLIDNFQAGFDLSTSLSRIIRIAYFSADLVLAGALIFFFTVIAIRLPRMGAGESSGSAISP